jgi:hypothetical protein
LPKATLIERMRILGARLEVVGDEARATPEPGEQVRVTFSTAFPTLEGSTEEAETLLVGCTAPERFTGGLPVCQEFIDAIEQGQVDLDLAAAVPMFEEKVTCARLRPTGRFDYRGVSVRCLRGEPSISLPVRPDFDAEKLLFLGVVCQQGQAYVDASDPLIFGCEDNGEGEIFRVNGLVPVQRRASEQNLNPSLEDDLEITLNRRPWLPFDRAMLPPEDNCESRTSTDSLPIRVGGDHRIRLSYDPDARDLVDGEPETVELSVHATAGEVERRFTLFAPDEEEQDGRLVGELDWTAPKPGDEGPDGEPIIAPGGRIVRFFITVRDQRGGYDVIERALCVK